MPPSLSKLLSDIHACRHCVEQPAGAPLPHLPRPVLRVSKRARIAIFSQAPGARVHASGLPFSDPSGMRLRDWMGVTEDEFYNIRHVAFVPMGFCFPGLDAKGGDLPPRPECAPHWRSRLLERLDKVELVLLVGQYAQRWHLGHTAQCGLTRTVAAWHDIYRPDAKPRTMPMPHPSWRNNAWLKANPWFEAALLPVLRIDVRRILATNRKAADSI